MQFETFIVMQLVDHGSKVDHEVLYGHQLSINFKYLKAFRSTAKCDDKLQHNRLLLLIHVFPAVRFKYIDP